MEHFVFTPTLLSHLPYFSQKWGVNLFAKRDDLFPSALGGSKSRMLQYILYPLKQKGIKTIVTAGGPYSNFNRAIALLCAEYGIKLKLVSYTDNPEEYRTSLNNSLVELSGCEYIYCKKTEVPQVIEKVMSHSDNSTYFVYGGGKSLPGIYAYYDAIKELKEQMAEIDALFVACGTGTTLTGICAGMQSFYPNAKVHGISVARSYDVARYVLKENMSQLNEYLNTSYDFSNLIFHDEFLCGGYAQTSSEELDLIKECISKEGMVIDPTYVGKAFYGMSNILIKSCFANKNILFWNTGGVINLLSQRQVFNK